MENKTEWRPGPTVCRCCLAEGCYKDISTEYFWMGKREVYAEMLADTLDLTIGYSSSAGPYSNSRLICEPCITRLRDACDFKRQVQECEKTFMQQLNPENIPSVDVVVQPLETTVKVEAVKSEVPVSDDDGLSDVDFGVATADDDDDDDDDEYNEPLTKLASKVPKKEKDMVDLIDLADNRKATEKRKSSAKSKASPAKKAKTAAKVNEPVASASTASASKVEKKKKGLVTERKELRTKWSKMKHNIITVLENTTACPFRWRLNTLMCFYCDEKFTNVGSLYEHTPLTHKNVIKSFYGAKWERKHVKIEISQLACIICGQKYEHLEEIKRHLIEHGKVIHKTYDFLPYKLSKQLYTCHYCAKVFNRFNHLTHHFNQHFRNYVCDVCGEPFAERNHFKQHIKLHAGGPSTCTRCGLSFTSVSAKRQHIISTHRNRNIIPCPYCKERFSHTNQKFHHMAQVHDVKNSQCQCPSCKGTKRTVDVFKAFQCDECDKRFSKKEFLSRHKRTHLGIKYKCEICDKLYANRKSLKRHLLIHSNDRRFACKECGRAFVQNQTLKNHMRVHFVHQAIQQGDINTLHFYGR